jgi:hypothetical protein
VTKRGTCRSNRGRSLARLPTVPACALAIVAVRSAVTAPWAGISQKWRRVMSNRTDQQHAALPSEWVEVTVKVPLDEPTDPKLVADDLHEALYKAGWGRLEVEWTAKK